MLVLRPLACWGPDAMTKPQRGRWGGPQQPTNLFDVSPARESDYEDVIIQAADTLGYRAHTQRAAFTKDGFRTAIKGHVGWPDLFIVGYGRVFVYELKRKPNGPTSDQLAWIALLKQAGIDARVAYVPEELQAILDDLTNWRANALKKGNTPP